MGNVFNINIAQYSPLACDELVTQIFSAKNELPTRRCSLNELPSKSGSGNELHPYSSILNDLPPRPRSIGFEELPLSSRVLY